MSDRDHEDAIPAGVKTFLDQVPPFKAVDGLVPVLKDSGERRQFPTGAVRDRAVGKGRFDLIPTQMEFSIYVDAAERHLEKYKAGWMDEDHLAAAIWNLAALMFQEEKNPQLDNLPERRREAVDMFKWVIRKPEDA
jgi:hypothetical protein